MSRSSPTNRLAVKAQEAARLLSLTLDEFADLVDQNALPRPIMIGGKYERWCVSEIADLLAGENIGDEDFET